jgi:hypothetical protein
MEERCVLSTIFVSSLADGPGNPNLVTPTTGGFNAPSLRAAISFHNITPSADTIDLMTPGVYQITLPKVTGAMANQNQGGAFDILASGGNLTINNTSGGAVTVSGNGIDRVFDINPNFNFDPNNPTPKFTVTMEGFTITDGFAFSPAFTDGNGAIGSGNNPVDVTGGAIRDSFNASLTLQNMVISGNASQAAGGGISMENPLGFSTPWTLKVLNSTISNNRSGDAGGGINTIGSGRVIVTQSVISNNVCENQGAGIWLDTVDTNDGNTHNSSVLTVTQSIISDNVSLAADNFGGGIGNAGNDTLAPGQTPLPGEIQAVSIIDSTVANNTTASTGGGYGDQGGQGTLFVQNSTFTGNSANAGGGIQADGPSTTILNSTITDNSSQTSGGGLMVMSPSFTLDNTIVAQNFAGPANFLETNMGPDVMAAVTSGAGNFIGIGDTSLTGLTAGTSGNQIGTTTSPLNPELGPLQNNGGPAAGAPGATQTVATLAPLAGSPVIDKGVNLASLPTTDERGGVRVINNTVDIGAVEFQPPATSTLVTTSGPVTYGMPLTFTAMVAAQVPGDAVTGTVTFSIDGKAVGTGSVTSGMATLSFTPTLATLTPGSHMLTATYGGDANFTPSASTAQTLVAPLPSTTTTLSLSGTVAYGKPLTLTATVTGQVTSTPVTGMVSFNLDGQSLGMAPVMGGMAALTITPTPATLKPGSHTLIASYSGDTNFSASMSAPTTITPALPQLTTMLTRMRGRFMLEVLDNGQNLQQFTLNTQPLVQMRDVNGDGIADLVISIKQRKKLVVFTAFNGATAQRIM